MFRTHSLPKSTHNPPDMFIHLASKHILLNTIHTHTHTPCKACAVAALLGVLCKTGLRLGEATLSPSPTHRAYAQARRHKKEEEQSLFFFLFDPLSFQDRCTQVAPHWVTACATSVHLCGEKRGRVL